MKNRYLFLLVFCVLCIQFTHAKLRTGCVGNTKVKSIKFQENISISYDGTTAFPTDFDWELETRNSSTNTSIYQNYQSVPVAFVRKYGDGISMEVVFKVDPNVTSIKVYGSTGSLTGLFGFIFNTASNTTIECQNGYSKPAIFKTQKSPSTVDVNTLKIDWILVAEDGGFIPPPYTPFDKASHRIYTLFDTPTTPMAKPWSVVLELACNIAKGTNNTHDIMKELSKGIIYSYLSRLHLSEFNTLPVASEEGLTHLADYVYDGRTVRTLFHKSGNIDFDQLVDVTDGQDYDFNSYLTELCHQNIVRQQCSDNASLLWTFASALGIQNLKAANFYRLYDHNGTKHYKIWTVPAGMEADYLFHQAIVQDNKVYDPTEEDKDEFLGTDINTYMSTFFGSSSIPSVCAKYLEQPPHYLNNLTYKALGMKRFIASISDLGSLTKGATSLIRFTGYGLDADISYYWTYVNCINIDKIRITSFEANSTSLLLSIAVDPDFQGSAATLHMDKAAHSVPFNFNFNVVENSSPRRDLAIDNSKELKAIPNPANDIVSVKYPAPDEIAYIEAVNGTGVVFTVPYQKTSNNGLLLDVKALAIGIY